MNLSENHKQWLAWILTSLLTLAIALFFGVQYPLPEEPQEPVEPVELGANFSNPVDIEGSSSASAPALTFEDDTDTGIFRSAADTFNFAAGGTEYVEIDSSAVTFATVVDADAGATIDGAALDANAGATIDGGVTNVGGGTPSLAAGDNDLYVTGDFEYDGLGDFDGDATLQGDFTLETESTGGNAGAVNQFIGLPSISIVDLAQGTNPASETVDCMDATPTGEWTEIDAGTNVAVTADTSTYRYDTNSVELAATSVVAGDGVNCALPAQDDLSGLESVGFWLYSDEDIVAGDIQMTLDDSDGTDQVYTSTIAVSADVWTWLEIDISGCDANCDTADNFKFIFTTQGATNLTDPAIYFDELFYWDSADEEALGQDIVDHGVISVLTVPTAAGTANTWGVEAEYTDYIVHYESGNDFIVWITDESANEVLALIAH
jgi:hypothetical protein